MWIKICGMCSAAAVEAALAAGVDAIGFVFAPSARRVQPADAARLAARVRGRMQCVAVMRHPAQRELDEVLEEFRPDVLQTDAADLGRLRLPRSLELLPVLRRLPVGEAPARLLFEGEVSGAGERCDWQAAQSLARRSRLVLAGGLNAGNVRGAIAAVHPFGVDVSSGVESALGVKSAAAVLEFAQAARAAFQHIEEC